MPTFRPIIAERQLVERASGNVVRVSLGAPRRGTDGAPWECPFRIRGAGVAVAEVGSGQDSMQALMTAMDGIRALLDESRLSLGWKLGPGREGIWDGETGFTRSIPIALGPAVRRRLERVVDQELQREVQRLKRRSTRRATSTPRKSRKAR